jgi:hypothetical protein
VLEVRVGDELLPEILLEALDEGGYAREDPVTARGQMARRGGILDVFPSDADEPVRIEFFGDTVESLRRFDPDTQRAPGRSSRLEALPLADLFATRSLLAALPARAGRALRGAARARGLQGVARARAARRTARRAAAARARRDGAALAAPAAPAPWWWSSRRPCSRRPRRSSRGRARTARAAARACCPRSSEALVPPEALAAYLAGRAGRGGARGRDDGGGAPPASRPAPSYAGDMSRLATDLRATSATTVVFLGNPGRADRLATCCARTASRSARARAS